MQIWVTYDEFARFAAKPVAAAREEIAQNGWDRRQSRDGNIRVKLPNHVAVLFALHALNEEASMSAGRQAEALRTALLAMQTDAAGRLAIAA